MTYREHALTGARTRIGTVFQQFNLFPHLTVEENVSIGPVKILGLPRQEAGQRALANLERVGVGEKAGE